MTWQPMVITNTESRASSRSAKMQKIGKYWQTRVTIGILIYALLQNITNQGTIIILAEYFETAYPGNSTVYNLVSTAYGLGNMATVIPLAKLSDRIGRRKTLIYTFIVSTASQLLIAISNSVWLILLGRFLFGICTYTAVSYALIDDYYSENSKGKPISYFSISMLTGFLLGSLFSGSLLNLLGSTGSLIVMGGFMFLALVNIALNIRDTPYRKKIDAPQATPNNRQLHSLKLIFKNRPLSAVLLNNFLANIVFMGGSTYFSYMIISYYEIDASLAGVYFIPPLFANISAFYIIGRLKKPSNTFRSVFMVSIIGIVGIVLIFLFDDIITFIAVGSVLGFLSCALVQANDLEVLNFVPVEQKGEILGVYKLMAFLSAAVGPSIIGLLSDFVNPLFPFVLMLGLNFIVYLIYRKLVQPYKN